jgi:hypothetical protein
MNCPKQAGSQHNWGLMPYASNSTSPLIPNSICPCSWGTASASAVEFARVIGCVFVKIPLVQAGSSVLEIGPLTTGTGRYRARVHR